MALSQINYQPILSFSERCRNGEVPVFASFDDLALDYGCSAVSIREIAFDEGVPMIKTHGDRRHFVAVAAFREAAEGKYRCCDPDSCRTHIKMQRRAEKIERADEQLTAPPVEVQPDKVVLSPKCQNLCRTCTSLPHCMVVFGPADMVSKLTEEIAQEVGHK